jgi:Kef-type K+ transport system membrane component KefB
MINKLTKGSMMRKLVPLFAIVSAVFPSLVLAAENSEPAHGSPDAIYIIAFFAVAIVLAKSAGALVEKAKLPAVLGELGVGVLLGVPALFGWHAFDALRENELVKFLAEFGVIVLLFQAGLESNIREMGKVGARALLVACVGVAAPFLLGYFVVGPWLMPNESSNAHLFLGAALTATSVGITARVFKDLGTMQTKAAKIVLGAAVIDDVLGLIILAVVAAVVSGGGVSAGSIAWITAKAIVFLVGSIALGRVLAPKIGDVFSGIHKGSGMKMAIALVFCFGYAYLATLVGLAPIVGAFAAGLLLDPVHFRRFSAPKLVDDIRTTVAASTDQGSNERLLEAVAHHHERHVEDLIENLSHWFVPIFFIVTGFQVNLAVFGDASVLLVAGVLTLAAIVGKLASGSVAGKGTGKLAVGVGMIPRGEVGLIFANVGKALGVMSDQAFAAVVIMVILTTVITPFLLPLVMRKDQPAEAATA